MAKVFEKIVVEYPPEDLCTYPEYKGKPYFSIQYEEDGKHFIGFGTYKPEVLSEYISEYFISQPTCEDWMDVPSDEMTIEQARQAVKDLRKKLADTINTPCEDAISRKAVKDAVESTIAKYIPMLVGDLKKIPLELAVAINKLSSVTSIREHGEWIPISSGNLPDYRESVLIQLECERTAYIGNNEVIKYDVAFRVNYKHPMFDADYYWMGKTAYNPTDVIAWQLPEPYTEKGAEQCLIAE